jgi:V/A-type H+-transporting ATPase subunit I
VLVPMTKVRILGPRSELEPAIDELHRLGLVEIADARASEAVDELGGDEARSARREALRLLATRLDALLAEVPDDAIADDGAQELTVRRPLDASAVGAELERLSPAVEALRRRQDGLRDEALVLPGYLEPLRRLLPLAPEIVDLDDAQLRLLRLGTVALVLNTDDESVVDTLRDLLAEEFGERFHLVWTHVPDGGIGCLVVFPVRRRHAVEALLGRAQVRQAALPDAFERLSLRAAVEAMRRRLAELPQAISAARTEREALLLPHAARLRKLRIAIAGELERLEAVERTGATQRAFVAVCWVPRRQLARLARELDTRLGGAVLVEDLATSPRDPQAPLLMRNPSLARPFEPLVRFLDLPRAGSFDPTLLTALFLPVMFGAMVGDVGYGVVLLALALMAHRSLNARASAMAGLTWVLVAGAAWSIVFGLLFGELFGDLGTRVFGDWALWQDRLAAEALVPLLLFAVAIGAAHVVLGLALGAWQAILFGERGELFDKVGSVLVLGGLFGLAGWAADRLSPGTLTPSVALTVVGLVLVLAPGGAIGLITGPLALLGRLGNILSYLRLAAVGLASAHLASVANELATIGPIWMGVLVAAFFHALNLALASFSPMIQALRLHYVEFFGTFLTGGGRAFAPFGAPEHETSSTT